MWQFFFFMAKNCYVFEIHNTTCWAHTSHEFPTLNINYYYPKYLKNIAFHSRERLLMAAMNSSFSATLSHSYDVGSTVDVCIKPAR